MIERLARVLLCDRPILLVHRARNPRHVVMRDEAAKRRHEAAAAPLGRALSDRGARIGHRSAVRDDDQLAAPTHERNLSGPLLKKAF